MDGPADQISHDDFLRVVSLLREHGRPLEDQVVVIHPDMLARLKITEAEAAAYLRRTFDVKLVVMGLIPTSAGDALAYPINAHPENIKPRITAPARPADTWRRKNPRYR